MWQYNDTSNAELSHYGILGMKWGRRSNRQNSVKKTKKLTAIRDTEAKKALNNSKSSKAIADRRKSQLETLTKEGHNGQTMKNLYGDRDKGAARKQLWKTEVRELKNDHKLYKDAAEAHTAEYKALMSADVKTISKSQLYKTGRNAYMSYMTDDNR